MTVACRMDLAAARSGDADAVQRERSRFMRAIQPLLQHDGPKLLVTDSQVRDVCAKLCAAETTSLRRLGAFPALLVTTAVTGANVDSPGVTAPAIYVHSSAACQAW